MTIYLRWWIQIAAATALAAACTADSAAPGGAAPVAGAWQFTGQESSGAGRTFSGVLALVSESSTTFSGTSDVVQTAAGQPPVSPWGQQAKGYRTRKNKRTDVMIVRRRHAK